MVQHIVLLKLKEGTTHNQTQAVLDGLTGLIGKLPGILSVIGGENISPEGKSAGFGWGFVMAFEDLASRDTYLTHPDHVAVSVKFIRPIVEDVLVFDCSAG